MNKQSVVCIYVRYIPMGRMRLPYLVLWNFAGVSIRSYGNPFHPAESYCSFPGKRMPCFFRLPVSQGVML